jgi:hypothetical protein
LRIRRDPSQLARRTYDAHVAEYNRNGGGDRAPLRSFFSARSAIQRTRHKAIPEIPRTIEDVNIFGVWSETWNGRQFLQYHSPEWGITMFATAKNLKILRRCGTQYMDATFKTVPRLYAQMFTIHGLYRGMVVPLLVTLMS